eukprot:5653899-Pleurochrysis_carterae.AAC.2
MLAHREREIEQLVPVIWSEQWASPRTKGRQPARVLREWTNDRKREPRLRCLRRTSTSRSAWL